MTVSPLTGVLGARVDGLELAPDMEPEVVADLRRALCEHEVVVVPGQDLSPDEQAGFSHLLGGYSPVPFVQPLHEHPEVIKVVKEATEPDAFNFGGVWHSDFSFLDTPPAFTVLHALDVPPVGGDTVWASMTAAHDQLPDDVRIRLEEVTAVHSASASYSPAQQELHSGLSGMDIRTSESAEATRDHPLLCTHPETGRRSLFFNGTYVRGLRGPGIGDGTEAGSREEERLLRWLHEFSTHVRFTFRHRWSDGDVVLWDNRSTQHVALNDYAGHRRELHRTTVAGPEPVA
ncbi:MAG: TauD/TfdA family dioxygenase [Myxococcota bacterium]|jgi:taurine dioxygenase|nr:TauD/TfdA family dioxygenase [Myxococcota bacterium]